ncbi:hypothetical protein [Chroococcidiopsis sp. CCMEE 29]|nr:hypothetical protein [Chroococcidiopsis sp. CCMEE 29]
MYKQLTPNNAPTGGQRAAVPPTPRMDVGFPPTLVKMIEQN